MPSVDNASILMDYNAIQCTIKCRSVSVNLKICWAIWRKGLFKHSKQFRWVISFGDGAKSVT